MTVPAMLSRGGFCSVVCDIIRVEKGFNFTIDYIEIDQYIQK